MKLRLSRERLLIGIMLASIVINSILFPATFPTLANASAVLRGLAFDGIMACGMMLLLIAGTLTCR